MCFSLAFMAQLGNIKGLLGADSLGEERVGPSKVCFYTAAVFSSLFTKGLVCGSGEESYAWSFVEAERKGRGAKVKSCDRWILMS